MADRETGALLLTGDGTLILGGTGSYGGGTTVDGGILGLEQRDRAA